MSINDLANVAPVARLDESDYEPPKAFAGIPVDGVYMLQLPGVFPDDAFSEDIRKDETAGHLRVQIDPVIVGDADGSEDVEGKNYTLRYQSASTRVFKSRKASQFADLVMATGNSPAEVPMDPLEIVEWIRVTLAEARFAAYCQAETSVKLANGTYINLRGRRAFDAANLRKLGFEVAEDAEGFQWSFPHPTFIDAKTKQPKVLYANLRVSRYVVPE